MLGIDYGARRIGLALSDATATLASPWRMLQRPPSEAETLRILIAEIIVARRTTTTGSRRWWSGGRVVSMDRPPIRRRSSQTFAQALKAQIDVPVILQDERLSSPRPKRAWRARERDWRKRKQQLDAAAAAVILQDYLDSRPPTGPVMSEEDLP